METHLLLKASLGFILWVEKWNCPWSWDSRGLDTLCPACPGDGGRGSNLKKGLAEQSRGNIGALRHGPKAVAWWPRWPPLGVLGPLPLRSGVQGAGRT